MVVRDLLLVTPDIIEEILNNQNSLIPDKPVITLCGWRNINENAQWMIMSIPLKRRAQ
ncbi:hypothetical protein PHLCEN_2v8343 [Hermanssonia centrifuga]|uniref:Uncharacterized protein n=1 Tax=Hermanssonia centrifuga TaxID=98765 RepID=A0A2R6NTW0_9APHY|nr:hypothetical protein PHLCEN_2v8343 [Hermanssonia centrifuga]